MSRNNRTVRFVVKNRLCTACGTCVAACPASAISMRETPAGFPRPIIDVQTCTECGLCYDVCSGIQYHFDLPEDVDGLFWPRPLTVFLGRATDPTIHAFGQSGGVITGLLTFLMQQKQISHALVTRMPRDGSVRPQAFFAASPEELLECVGSKYCLNPLNAALTRWPKDSAGVAAVGLGCHVHGIRNLEHVLPKQWENRFQLIIGLFCLKAAGFLCFDHLLRFRAHDKPVSRVFFRKKAQAGKRGYPCIEYTDGTCQDFPVDFLWEFFHDKFVPLRCRFCFDQLNRMSDLAVGDPNGYSKDIMDKGVSVIAVYTSKGLDTLRKAQEQGAIELIESSAEKMWGGLHLANRKQRVVSTFTRWKQLDRCVCDVPALKALPAASPSISTCWTMEHQWKIEGISTRAKAYRKILRFWKLIGFLGGLKSRLLRMVRTGH
ncbi:MAG: 4Fe-4S dicluster domain-containing protein [Anaerolineaceae bacterium]|nr:4Fe-4S dicluster domain-containing protein [Anaerolineaceae bacterium]